MRKYLLDTNIISYYLKGDEGLKEKISNNIDTLAISIISYYEIISGLQGISANKRITEFERFCELIDVINLDRASILASCQIYSDLKKSGNLIDDIDILIADIALSNNLIMITDKIEREIAVTDEAIDEIVYGLYGITGEERKIIVHDS